MRLHRFGIFVIGLLALPLSLLFSFPALPSVESWLQLQHLATLSEVQVIERPVAGGHVSGLRVVRMSGLGPIVT